MNGSMLNKICLFMVVLSGSFTLSCASRKALVSPTGETAKIVSRAERTHIINEVVQHRTYYTTFSGRAKSRITMNGKETYDVTANVRIERDKAIWISITALMGIEAGRVLITPDSVKMINRLRSEYFTAPLDSVYSFTGSDLDFSSFQALLTGNVIDQAVSRDAEVSAMEAGNILSSDALDGGLSYWIALNTGYRPVTVLLENTEAQRLEAAYAGYQAVNGRLFPFETALSIRAGRWDIQASMNYNRVAYDEAVEFPFGIPASYKEIQ